MRLKGLDSTHGVHDGVEKVMLSIFVQSVEALDAFLDEVRTQRVDRFGTGLMNVYSGSQLASPYKSTNTFGVEVASFEVQSPASPVRKGTHASATNLQKTAPLKPVTFPVKGSCDRFEKARRYFYLLLEACYDLLSSKEVFLFPLVFFYLFLERPRTSSCVREWHELF